MWDKDRLGKDFLGEIAFPLSKIAVNFAQATPVTQDLLGKNLAKEKRGTITLKIGFGDATEDDWAVIDTNLSSLTGLLSYSGLSFFILRILLFCIYFS